MSKIDRLIKSNIPKDDKSIIGNYRLEKTIGEGTFGKVKLGIHIPTEERVAVKILEKDKIQDKEDLDRITREITFLKKLRNQNVIKIYEIVENSKNFYIIMEYASGGELFNYIVNKKRLEEAEASFFFVQIINGLEYIHKNNIVHRDMKPENLLLTEGKILKIIDFGLSNSYRYGQLLSTPCGSPCYAAPEMILGRKYSGMLVDTWSTGIILYAMVCGYLPFEDKNNERLYNKILECKLELPEHLSFTCKDLIKKILTVNPSRRIKLDDIKHHPFLKAGEALKRSDSSFSNTFNEKVFDMMTAMGFDKNDVKFNLENNKHNNTTTTYDLLVKKQIRINVIKSERKNEMYPAKETVKENYCNINPSKINPNVNSNTNTNNTNSEIKSPRIRTADPSIPKSNSPNKKNNSLNSNSNPNNAENTKNINININCKNKIGNINININDKEEQNDSGVIIVEEPEPNSNKEAEDKGEKAESVHVNILECNPQCLDQIDNILNTLHYNNTINNYENQNNILLTENDNEIENFNNEKENNQNENYNNDYESERKQINEITEILGHKDGNVKKNSTNKNISNTNTTQYNYHYLNTSVDRDIKTERTERFNRAAYLSGNKYTGNKNSIRRAKIAVSMSKSRPAKGSMNAFNAVNNTLLSENPNNNSINLDISSYLMKNKYESNNIILPNSLLPTVNRIGKNINTNKFLSFNLVSTSSPSTSPSARTNKNFTFNKNTINTSITYEKSSPHEFNTFSSYRQASPDVKMHSISNKFVPSNTIDLVSCNTRVENSTEESKKMTVKTSSNFCSTPTNTSLNNSGNDYLIRNKYFGKFNSNNILCNDKMFFKRSLSLANEETRSKTDGNKTKCNSNANSNSNALCNAVNNVNINLVDISQKNVNDPMKKIDDNIGGNVKTISCNNSKTNRGTTVNVSTGTNSVSISNTTSNLVKNTYKSISQAKPGSSSNVNSNNSNASISDFKKRIKNLSINDPKSESGSLYHNLFNHNNLSYGNEKSSKLNQSYKSSEKIDKSDNYSAGQSVMITEPVNEKAKSKFATQRNNSGNTSNNTRKQKGKSITGISKIENTKAITSITTNHNHNINNNIPLNPSFKPAQKTSNVSIKIPNSEGISIQTPSIAVTGTNGITCIASKSGLAKSSSKGNNIEIDTLETKDENSNCTDSNIRNIPNTTKNKCMNTADLIKRENNYSPNPYLISENYNFCDSQKICNTFTTREKNDTLRSLNSSVTARDKDRDLSARMIDLTNTLTPVSAFNFNNFNRTKSPSSNYSQMFKMKGKPCQPSMTAKTTISLKHKQSPNNLLNSPVVSNYLSQNGHNGKTISPDRKTLFTLNTLNTLNEKDRNSIGISTPSSHKYKDYFKSGSLKSANLNGKKQVKQSGNVTKFTTHNIEKDLIRNIAKGSESEVAEFACCTLSGSNAININLRLKEFCLNNNLILKEINMSKFECRKDHHVVSILITKIGLNKVLKLQHIAGTESVTKEIIKNIIITVGF